jgi:hypothetical protein
MSPSPRRNRWFADSPLEEAVSSELVSEGPNSLLAGNIQGSSSPRRFGGTAIAEKEELNQWLTAEFPTHPYRELISALQGIKWGYQGTSRPDQRILFFPVILAFPALSRNAMGPVSNAL